MILCVEMSWIWFDKSSYFASGHRSFAFSLLRYNFFVLFSFEAKSFGGKFKIEKPEVALNHIDLAFIIKRIKEKSDENVLSSLQEHFSIAKKLLHSHFAIRCFLTTNSSWKSKSKHKTGLTEV